MFNIMSEKKKKEQLQGRILITSAVMLTVAFLFIFLVAFISGV